MKETKFTFLSADGRTAIHAVKWIPDDGSYSAIVQIVHGMREYIERYQPFAEYLTEHGIAVVGHCHLGHGDSIVSKADCGYFAKDDPSGTLVKDIHSMRQSTTKEMESVPYFMLGHSMGSYLLRKYISLHGEGLSGAILSGTGCVPDGTTKLGMTLCKIIAQFHGWYYRSSFIESLSFAGPYKQFCLDGSEPERSWLTKDQEIVKAYYSEPRCMFHFTLNGFYGLMDTVLYDNQIEHVKQTPASLPIYIISGQDDPVGDMGVGVKKVYALYQSAGIQDVTCRLFENDRHEILNETDRDIVCDAVYEWIRSRIEKES